MINYLHINYICNFRMENHCGLKHPVKNHSSQFYYVNKLFKISFNCNLYSYYVNSKTLLASLKNEK